MQCHQEPFGQHQIGQAKQCQQLRGVLLQVAIARLAMLEQVLYDMEGTRDLGLYAGLGLLYLFQQLP